VIDQESRVLPQFILYVSPNREVKKNTINPNPPAQGDEFQEEIVPNRKLWGQNS